jgi:phosphatidylethanolamine-binding protein (PEBP) family uncharacterized protein
MHEQTRLRRPKSALRAGTVVSFLVAGTIAAVGCGETASNKRSGAAPSGLSGSTPSTTTSTTTASAAASASHDAGSSGAKKTSHGPRHHAAVRMALPGPDSRPAPTLTPAQRANVAVADIRLASPAIKQAHLASTPRLGRRYTCRGSDQSPPLRWTGVPSGTKELALFAISTKPVQGKLFFDWAVAKLDPSLKGLTAGSLPAGAVTGQSSSGREAYSICPSGSGLESYVFVLYALPRSLSPQPGFNPAALRQQAMAIARHTGLLVGSYG